MIQISHENSITEYKFDLNTQNKGGKEEKKACVGHITDKF